MKRIMMLCLVAMGVLALGVGEARAIGTAPGSVAEELLRSTAVFAGRVVRIEDKAARGQELVTFEVIQSWKGVASNTVTVATNARTDAMADAGGYRFRQGEEYLVYANEVSGELMTSVYTRTKPWASADREIVQLTTLAKDRANLYLPGGTVTGRVVDKQGNPVAGATVHVWSAAEPPRRGIAHAQSGADGRFTVDGVPPGKGYCIEVMSAANPKGMAEVPGIDLADGEMHAVGDVALLSGDKPAADRR